MKLRLPSPSFVVAALALSLATGGVGYAAGALPHNSVGSAQLKKNAVTAKKIKDGAITTAKLQPGAVTSDKIPDGGLTGADLAAGSVTGAKVVPNSLGGAQIDESTLALPAKPGTLLLAGTDFVPQDSSYTHTTVDGHDLYTTTPDTGFAATLRVPAGATITGIKVGYVDNGPQDIEVYVAVYNPLTGAGNYATGGTTTGADAGSRTLTISPRALPAGSLEDVTVHLPTGSQYRLLGAEVTYQ